MEKNGNREREIAMESGNSQEETRDRDHFLGFRDREGDNTPFPNRERQIALAMASQCDRKHLFVMVMRQVCFGETRESATCDREGKIFAIKAKN